MGATCFKSARIEEEEAPEQPYLGDNYVSPRPPTNEEAAVIKPKSVKTTTSLRDFTGLEQTDAKF